MAMFPSTISSSLGLLSLLLALSAAASDNCFWRSNNTINAEGDGWFACNNTQINPGGAQLCCIAGSQCGEDSICHNNNGYYIGGCTDGNYEDPVCNNNCTDDTETWIQWDLSANEWQCCGDAGCNGSPTSEIFSAVAPVSWTPIPSAAQSSTATSTTPGSTSTTATATTTASSSSTTAAGGNDDNGSGGLSTSAQAGIGVASGLIGVAIVGGLGFWVLRRKRRSGKQDTRSPWQQEQEMMQHSHYGGRGYASPGEQTPMYPQELPPKEPNQPQELPGAETAELEGGLPKR